MFNIYPPKANKYLRRSATRVLASNFITDAKFACEVYVAKAGIEQFYNWTKNALEGRTFNVSTDKSLSGKNFILALSTELYWQINHAFRNFRDENGKPLKLIHNSVRATLRDLDSIESVSLPNERKFKIPGGVTTHQDAYYQALGINSPKSFSKGSISEEGFVSEKGTLISDENTDNEDFDLGWGGED